MNDIGRVRPGPASTSERECRDAVHAFVVESDSAGVPPTMELYQLLCRERGWPSRNTVTRRLGQPWPELVEQARTTPSRRRFRPTARAPHPRRLARPAPTAEETIRALAAAGQAHGLRVTVSDYRRWARGRDVPSPDVIRSRFGSWAAACRAAGVLAGRGSWSAVEVVVQLRRARAALGSPFTARRFTDWAAEQQAPISSLNADVAGRVLGSWTACRAAANGRTKA